MKEKELTTPSLFGSWIISAICQQFSCCTEGGTLDGKLSAQSFSLGSNHAYKINRFKGGCCMGTKETQKRKQVIVLSVLRKRCPCYRRRNGRFFSRWVRTFNLLIQPRFQHAHPHVSRGPWKTKFLAPRTDLSHSRKNDLASLTIFILSGNPSPLPISVFKLTKVSPAF